MGNDKLGEKMQLIVNSERDGRPASWIMRNSEMLRLDFAAPKLRPPYLDFVEVHGDLTIIVNCTKQCAHSKKKK